MTFNDFVTDALQGAIPGTYMYTRPRNSVSRESLKSAYNQRAREGFRYWLIEKPKPTSCKYFRYQMSLYLKENNGVRQKSCIFTLNDNCKGK